MEKLPISEKFRSVAPLLALLLGLTLAGCLPNDYGQAAPRSWSFPAQGVRALQLRCWRGREVRVEVTPGDVIRVTAVPRLQATSYHQPEPDWRNVRAGDWDFGWSETRTAAGELTLAATGEARFPHARYLLDEVVLTVPPGVVVKTERQALAAAEPP